MSSVQPIDVFVSYSAADRERVQPLVVALEEAGLSVWWDSRIAPGSGFDAEIQRALAAARCVLVVWSRRSITSEWVMSEAEEGLDRGVLVPVSIDAVSPPLAFRRRQTIEILDPAKSGEHVVSAVQASLEGKGGVFQGQRRPVPSTRRAPLVAVALVVGLAMGAVTMYALKETLGQAAVTAPLLRVPFPLDGWEDWKFDIDPTPSMVISADGNTVVFVARDREGKSSLHVRRLDRVDTVNLKGTQGARQPFFSPDDRWIGYFDSGLVKRVSLSGGEPSIITRVEGQTFGASWGPDDRIYYTAGRSGLQSVSVSGGDSRVETRLDADRGEIAHRLTDHVPGYGAMLFSVFVGRGSQPKHEIWTLDLATGERSYLFDGLAPTYIDSGHIVYAAAQTGGPERPLEVMGGSLWAVPFDVESMSVTGSPGSIHNAVAGREGSAYAVSRSGTLIYLPAQGDAIGELVLLAPEGPRVLSQGPLFQHPQFSNDGKSVAVATTEQGKSPSIRIYGIESNAVRQVADAGRFPLWDPDDQGITFTKIGVGLIRQSLDGAAAAQTLVQDTGFIVPNHWLNQGQTLVYHSSRGTFLHTNAPGADSEPKQLLGRDMAFPSLTTDAGFVAFCTWPYGVHVRSFSDKTSVSTATDSGCTPHWGNADTRLYFQDFNQLWAVDVSFGDGIVFGERELIADLGYPGISRFDVHTDGRIIVARQKDATPTSPVLMMNWARLLE